MSLNPHTNVELLEDTLQDIDLVLIMSVNPGFGGQQFIERTYTKVKKLRAMINAAGSNTIIEVDGGVNIDNARPLLDAGADALVAGSFVFRSENPEATIAALKAV